MTPRRVVAMEPRFPQFKPLGIEDHDVIAERLSAYRPEVSELTFTNLFIWHTHYGIRWSLYEQWLLMECTEVHAGCMYGLPPVGPPPRAGIVRTFLQWLAGQAACRPTIERAGTRLVEELKGEKDFLIEPTREHFDYVYRTEDLIVLPGRKYHAKRNHISQFTRARTFTYAEVDESMADECLRLADVWCAYKKCRDDLNLHAEHEAIRQLLLHYRSLPMKGGALLVDGKIEAFAFGEMLNDDTAVVHAEKANPEIPGLYAIINREFCNRAWQGVPFINREQDLGEEGLRKAKLSYHPHHMVEKYRITLKAEAGDK